MVNMNRVHIEQAFNVNHSIHFDPVPQARHRMTSNFTTDSLQRRPRFYDPSAVQKRMFASAVHRHLGDSFGISVEDYPLTDSSVSIDVTFIVSRPDSHFVGGDRDHGVRPDFERTPPTVQGDLDNFLKFFLDAMNGILYSDDRNVVTISASKLFTANRNGRVVFRIDRRDIDIVDLVGGIDIDNYDDNHNEI
jgi:Holliday junction resolvase RusA-like endonuclease